MPTPQVQVYPVRKMPTKPAPAHTVHMAPVSVTQEHDDWFYEMGHYGMYNGLKLMVKCDRAWMIWKAITRLHKPSTYCFNELHPDINYKNRESGFHSKSLFNQLNCDETGLKRIKHMLSVNNSQQNKYAPSVSYYDKDDFHRALLETHDFHQEMCMKMINSHFGNMYKPSDNPQISSYYYKIQDLVKEWDIDIDIEKHNNTNNKCRLCASISISVNKSNQHLFKKIKKHLIVKNGHALKTYDSVVRWRSWARRLNNRLRISSFDPIPFLDYSQIVKKYNQIAKRASNK